MSLEKPVNRYLRLATRAQSRDLDRYTIEEFGIDSITLMEIAGKKAADVIREKTGADASGIFVCGKGNNAGDALVAARYLSENAGHSVSLLLTAGSDNFSDDARKNYGLLKKLSENGSDITFQTDSDAIKWHTFDYAVDGLIGTGLTSELRQPMAGVVDKLNSTGLFTFSMDIPTGLNCDTGEILGTCVEADHTITFGTNKVGFYLDDGPSVTGHITLAELPFPEYLREHKAVLIDQSLRDEFDDNKPSYSHKYDKGTVHIIAGSEGMTGAAIMASKSAWNAGAGAVILYAPKGLLAVYEQALPEIIKIPVGDSKDVHFKTDHAEIISKKISNKPGVILIGPGLGLNDDTQRCVLELLEAVDQPVILDADGLSKWKESSHLDTSGWLLTPHPGELQKYLDIPMSTASERLREIEKLSQKQNVSILSKGFPTILATSKNGTYITSYDTRLFARAGFGDVLAGTIAGKLAVSKKTVQSITDALITNVSVAQKFQEPQPGDIYDR